MARLFADENFPLPTVIELRRLGHDVTTLQEIGLGGRAIPDESVLELAIQHGRALLTLNRRHFIRLHQVTPRHAGIIVCSFDPDFEARMAAQLGRLADSYGVHIPGPAKARARQNSRDDGLAIPETVYQAIARRADATA